MEVFAIVDEKVRDEFEKKFQIPYGYSTCYITFNQEEAIKSFRALSVLKGYPKRLVVEKLSEGYKEIVYKQHDV